jgi:hypothetical protein
MEQRPLLRGDILEENALFEEFIGFTQIRDEILHEELLLTPASINHQPIF